MVLIKHLKTWYYRTKLNLVKPNLNLCKPTESECIIQVEGDLSFVDLAFCIRPGCFHQHVHRRYIELEEIDRFLPLKCRASVILHKPKIRTVMIDGVATNYIAFVMYVTDQYGCVTVTWRVMVDDYIPITADELKWNIECDNNERARALISSPGGEEQIRYRQLETDGMTTI